MTTTSTFSKQSSTQATDSARAIIINVDDLGLSSAVNDAVLHLAECGRIGASSYMVGGTISEGEIKALTDLKVDIGLHLDLTGIFPSALRGSLKSIIVASYLRKLNPAQVKDVISQQLDAFEDRFGRAPVFVDGHQHIHQFPTIRQHLVKEISTRYGTSTSSQTSMSARVTTPLVHDLKSWIIYILGGKAWRTLCEDHHIATNDRFGGVYGFDATSQELSALWDTWLQKAPYTAGLPPALHTSAIDANPYSLPKNLDPTLIMCHPAVADNHWQDDIKQAREREYDWLMSHQFEQLLQQHKVRLVRWSDVTTSA